MPQKELSCVETLRFLRKLETVKPGDSAETARSHCTGIGKLVIQMVPKGELEAVFLLLGGIYCSPLCMINPPSPAQIYPLMSSILLKLHQTATILRTYQTRKEHAQKAGHSQPFSTEKLH